MVLLTPGGNLGSEHEGDPRMIEKLYAFAVAFYKALLAFLGGTS